MSLVVYFEYIASGMQFPGKISKSVLGMPMTRS